MIFTFFVENHLLGNAKLSFLVLWFKTLQAKDLISLIIFAFFVEHHLLGNTKLSCLVLWIKGYRPCREGSYISPCFCILC